MAPSCSCGFSFQLRGHLWVIAFELSGSPAKVIAVSLTTKRELSDTTVVMVAGDHRFITHDTVVNYADCREFIKSDLIARIEQKFFKVDEPFSTELLQKVQLGLIRSPFTPSGIKQSCSEVFDPD